jgi:hypothetical protein
MRRQDGRGGGAVGRQGEVSVVHPALAAPDARLARLHAGLPDDCAPSRSRLSRVQTGDMGYSLLTSAILRSRKRHARSNAMERDPSNGYPSPTDRGIFLDIHRHEFHRALSAVVKRRLGWSRITNARGNDGRRKAWKSKDRISTLPVRP